MNTNGAFATTAAALLAGITLAGASLAEPGASINRAQSASESVTVHSVDLVTRRLVVKRPSGELMSMKVPPEVRNLPQLKPGDNITTSYYRETAISLLPPGAAPPPDVARVVATHASPGEMPAGVAASRIVITGAIVAMDPAKHVLKVVSPSGGEVHEFAVVDPRGREMMGKLKVGDKITADINESLLISATRN